MEIAIVILLAILVVVFLWDRLRARRRWKEQGDALTKIVGEKVEGSVGVFGEVRERLGELTKRAKDIEDGILAVTEFIPDTDYPRRSTTIKLCQQEGFVLDGSLGNFWNYTVRFKKPTSG